MSTLDLIKLWWKIWAAHWLRITSPLTEQELDHLYQTCAGDPALRGLMDDISKLRR
jgi:hypothetical protein